MRGFGQTDTCPVKIEEGLPVRVPLQAQCMLTCDSQGQTYLDEYFDSL